ncbi:hypothetical protein GGI42DRAFT_232029 [Trichoderma sp. SZMC 28013]
MSTVMYRPEVVFILSVLFYSALVFLHLDLRWGERLEDYHELFHCVNWRKRVFARGWIRGRGCLCYRFAVCFLFLFVINSFFFSGNGYRG